MKGRWLKAGLVLALCFFLPTGLMAETSPDGSEAATQELEAMVQDLQKESVPSEAKPEEKKEAPAEQTLKAVPPSGQEGASEAAGSPNSENQDGQPTEEEAVAQRPNVVVETEVRGNQIISTQTILSKIQTQKGSPLVQRTVNEDLKRLYATGFFQDIKLELEERADGYKLVISVIEKPVIRQIVLDGYTEFKEDKLRKSLNILEGQILDQKTIKLGVEEIRKLYRDKGFRFVDIQSEVDVNRQTKEATIYIHITEGEKFRIKTITFEGVQAFKEKKLRKLMKTKPRSWFFRSGVFKSEDFNKDLERLQLFYQQEGYLDVKVAPKFDYDKQNKRIFITIQIEESQHYVTGDVQIKGNRLFPESEVWQVLEMLPGATYSQYYLSKDIEHVRDFYSGLGYIDARIIPDVKLNRDSGKVDVIYQIQEGDLYFVDKVAVRGNTKTKDIVVRRELRIRPGEKFDGEKIKKSVQRLENTGYFEEVTYDTQPSEGAPNRKDLVFRVKEKRTGELSFGGGVSSIDNFIGFAEISQRNFDLTNWPRFTGGGQSLSLRGRVGSYTQDYSLSFVEPYLFNKPLSFGMDIYNVRHDNLNVDFDEERRGAGITLSKSIRDIWRVGTGYTLERVTLDNISDDAPRTVRDFGGNNWLSRFRVFGSHDTRDNVFQPTKGHLANASAEMVGGFLGGSQDFYIIQTNFSQFWKFFQSHVLEWNVRLGASQEFGSSNEVPVFDRFYAGGLGTVRGFNYRRVGPIESGDAIGGQTIAVTNLEYTFPIPRLDVFRLAGFIDAGQVHQDSYKLDGGKFAVSIGPGVKIKTPIGPVAFYYGYPIANRDTKNKNGRFEFSLSRGF